MQWFRMWVDAIDDEKIRLLAFEDRWHFVALMCLKSSGLIDEPISDLRTQKICIKLGLDSRELETVVKRLVTVGLVSSDLQPVKWAKRQFLSDSSTKRVRKFRERLRNVSATPSEIRVQKQTTETEKNLDRRTARAASEPPEFSQIRQEYPKRSGGQRWGDALRFFKRRLAEGERASDILAGVQRYADYTRLTGIERTQHVQQAATFLGDNRGYLEQWHAPPRAKSAVEQAREDLRKPVNQHDNTVVSEQTGPGTSGSDLGSFARLFRG